LPSPVLLRQRFGSSQPFRLIWTSSHTHRISIEKRPAGHLSRSDDSRICREQVAKQWNATCGLCRPRHEQRTWIPLGRPKYYPGTPVRSSPSPSLEPSRQVTSVQPLRSWRPRMGPPPRIYAHDTVDPTALLRSKGATSRGTPFPLGKDDKIPAPDRTHGRAWQIQYTPG
jgi:hypothetical protein